MKNYFINNEIFFQDQKKSVWFKKQRYHCVYEYPKETPPMEHPSTTVSAWEPTSYAGLFQFL